MLPSLFRKSDDADEDEKPITSEEAAGYYWVEDKFGDVVMVYINDYKGDVRIKDLTKERTYHSFGDLKILEGIDFPEDYEEMKSEENGDDVTFTKRKLKMLYAGIITAFTVTIALVWILPRAWLLPTTFVGTTVTTITNVVIMLITIGLWKWKIFAEEKVGPSVDYLSDTMDKFEEAGMTVQRVSDFEPILVAIAEGIGSMDEDEINSAANAIRQFFDGISDVNDAEGLELDDSNVEDSLEDWYESNGK